MLRIEIFQQNACFRIAEMGNPILTYPLSPPSTVFGLLRYITSYKSINYSNTKIAISGIYESKIRHILINHITGISDDGKYKSNKIPTEELFNIRHIIHIDTEEEFEKDIQENISKAIRFGRKEDLIIEVFSKKVNKGEFRENFSEIKNITYYFYIPFENYKSLDSLAIFNLPVDSDKDLLDDGFLKMYYKKVLFLKIQRFVMKQNNDFKIDSDGYLYEWLN